MYFGDSDGSDVHGVEPKSCHWVLPVQLLLHCFTCPVNHGKAVGHESCVCPFQIAGMANCSSIVLGHDRCLWEHRRQGPSDELWG